MQTVSQESQDFVQTLELIDFVNQTWRKKYSEKTLKAFAGYQKLLSYLVHYSKAFNFTGTATDWREVQQELSRLQLELKPGWVRISTRKTPVRKPQTRTLVLEALCKAGVHWMWEAGGEAILLPDPQPDVWFVIQSYPKTYQPLIESRHESFDSANSAKEIANLGADYSTYTVAIKHQGEFYTLYHDGQIDGIREARCPSDDGLIDEEDELEGDELEEELDQEPRKPKISFQIFCDEVASTIASVQKITAQQAEEIESAVQQILTEGRKASKASSFVPPNLKLDQQEAQMVVTITIPKAQLFALVREYAERKLGIALDYQDICFQYSESYSPLDDPIGVSIQAQLDSRSDVFRVHQPSLPGS